MKFFELSCEDLTNLGGPMGTESTSIIFSKPYSTQQKAKDAAEVDHKKRRHDVAIKWTKSSRSGKVLDSGDLMSHMYYITEREVL